MHLNTRFDGPLSAVDAWFGPDALLDAVIHEVGHANNWPISIGHDNPLGGGDSAHDARVACYAKKVKTRYQDQRAAMGC